MTAIHEAIRVVGARVNNLRDVSVEIPKRQLTVFTGVSGSGKSSLVFGTIAGESQRLINETYPAFVQGFMTKLARPDVDVLENLSAAIVVDQEAIGSNARSTVGTATDVNALLRIVFSRCSVPYVGTGAAFSFNLPEGMCPDCEGLGRVSALDESQLVDRARSLNDGAITAPNFTVGGWYWKGYAETGRLDPAKRLADYTGDEWHWLMYQEPTKAKAHGQTISYEGLVGKVRRLYLDKEHPPKQAHIRAFVEQAATFAPCPSCGGTRLMEAARTAVVDGRTFPEVLDLQISDLAAWVDRLDEPSVAPLLITLRRTLGSLVEIGLGYLSLGREAGSLSGGEAQRLKMVKHLGSPLTDITYVFDEPTVGLHPHDVARMCELLLRLRDKGNTVLVVEHKPEVIAIADHVVDLGPGAGSEGGQVTYEGDVAGLRASDTRTGRLLALDPPGLREPRTPTSALEIRGAARNNLRDVDVDIPLGVLSVITGVAGSGKSSLVHGSLPPGAKVRMVDQKPIRGSIRSNPATYTGLLDQIRTAFAKANGVRASLFSANSEGACPRCKGLGVVYTDLAMMAGVTSPCEVCEGRRFTDEVLAHRLDGKSIDDVLRMPIAEAHEFFAKGKARQILSRLRDVGLGYVTLGQPLSTLSGGERQRLKLAVSMAEGPGTYVLDEPTSGLHLADIDNLLGLLDRLVDGGSSVICIEHHLAVMAHADWIIDIGPGAGSDGGRVVYEGTPSGMVANAATFTAHHLREYLAVDDQIDDRLSGVPDDRVLAREQ